MAGVLEQLDAGGTSTATYPLADALGSVRGLANASGAQAGATDYDVFGSVRARSGSSSVFGYTGQQTDPTGLVYLRARYLNPRLGRFLEPDTVQPNRFGTQGYNLYTYVANNPTSSVDPSGHQNAVSYGLTTKSTSTPIPATQATGVAAREAFIKVSYAWILANTELVAAAGAGRAGGRSRRSGRRRRSSSGVLADSCRGGCGWRCRDWNGGLLRDAMRPVQLDRHEASRSDSQRPWRRNGDVDDDRLGRSSRHAAPATSWSCLPGLGRRSRGMGPFVDSRGSARVWSAGIPKRRCTSGRFESRLLPHLRCVAKYRWSCAQAIVASCSSQLICSL